MVGPMTHVYEDYATVSGLTVPTLYTTYDPTGNVMGNHTVSDYSFTKKFDESRLQMPKGAVIDESSAERKSQSG